MYRKSNLCLDINNVHKALLFEEWNSFVNRNVSDHAGSNPGIPFQSPTPKSLGHKHGDAIKWKHFPRYWPFVWWIYRWSVNSPHKGQWRGAVIFSSVCAWINGWVKNRGAEIWDAIGPIMTSLKWLPERPSRSGMARYTEYNTICDYAFELFNS